MDYAIRDQHEPGYSPRPSKPQKLDAYRSYLQQRMTQAHPEWIPATVLYREIVAQGYQGSLSLLRAYLRVLKPKVPVEPLIRYETAPGEQMQVDFAHFRYEQQRFYAFVAVLGYSRALYVEFVHDQQLATLLTCHQHAFAYFGGVTLKVLYDNMKTVILKRHAYGEGLHQWQPSFLDFAKHYGFVPKACQPYRPQTKGKVERVIGYLRQSFYLPWQTQHKALEQPFDLTGLNQAVSVWLEQVAQQRVHTTLQAKPSERLVQEQAALQHLPATYTFVPPHTAQSITTNQTQAILKEHQSYLQHPLAVYDALLTEGCV